MERQQLDQSDGEAEETYESLEAELEAQLDAALERYHGNRKLTLPLAKEFFKMVEQGHPFETICDFLEISTGSFWNWMNRGKGYIEDGVQEDSEKIFGYFYVGTRKAFAKYRMQINKRLHENSPFWARDLEILARRDRRNFAKNEIQGGDAGDFDPDERFV